MKTPSFRSEPKPTARTNNHRLHRRYTSRTRPIITLLLVLICVPMFLYHILPSLSSIINDYRSSHSSRPATSTFCTKEVGSAQCCAIYLAAQPCLDECRKKHVDRETMALTAEYDECADQCLVEYNGVCKDKS
ncbi:zinc transporter yke4 [Pyrenophora seminiperda CCB06]|uniref:Zinc transporter yke4 n=1 Tax=Pyrenophora seminiperda CCB06 TaxID=1302712 RepID=A0A3M7M851_9PLEO|nr:zinc transporter yke4 [Pyrenophora seminiperda CCB06]